eukprot:Nk52_evm13s221 gene=Nk52_evmTU13s221
MSGVCIVILLMVLAHTDASQDGDIRELRETNAKGPVTSNSAPLYEVVSLGFLKEDLLCAHNIGPSIGPSAPPHQCELEVGVPVSCEIKLRANTGGRCQKPTKSTVTFMLKTRNRLYFQGLVIPDKKLIVPTDGDCKLEHSSSWPKTYVQAKPIKNWLTGNKKAGVHIALKVID